VGKLMASTASWVLYNLDRTSQTNASFNGSIADTFQNSVLPNSPYYYPSPGPWIYSYQGPGTVTQSGNIVTGNGTYFLSTMVGWTINFPTLSTSGVINSVSSSTSMSISLSQTFSSGTTYYFTIPSSVSNFNNIYIDNVNGADNYKNIILPGTGQSPMVLVGGSSNNSYSFWIGAQHNGSFNSLTSGAYLISIPSGSLPSGATINGTLSKYYFGTQSSGTSAVPVNGGDYTPPSTSITGDSPLYDGQVLNLDGVYKSAHSNWYTGNTYSYPFDTGGFSTYGLILYPAPFVITGGTYSDYDVTPYWTQPLRMQLQTSGPPIPKTNINITNFVKYYWSET
jgi:hypothetical protein